MGKKSVLDLTVVSGVIGGEAEWEWSREYTMGSDHFPIVTVIQGNERKEGGKIGAFGRWRMDEKANWEEFMSVSEEGIKTLDKMWISDNNEWRNYGVSRAINTKK